jgi:hypothetical protein
VVLLLQEVKQYLKITWSEEDEELTNIIVRGQSYLNYIAGTKLDFETDLMAKQLLFDYARYVFNHSLEMFEINFGNELLKLSIREGMKSYAESDYETDS